jgi:hypothetical protein
MHGELGSVVENISFSFACKIEQDETNFPIKLVITTRPFGLMDLKRALFHVFQIAHMIAVTPIVTKGLSFS